MGDSPTSRPSKETLEQALRLATESVETSSEPQIDTLTLQAQLALELGHVAPFQGAVAAMRRSFPAEPATFYFGAIERANAADFRQALVELEKAKAVGVDERLVAPLKADILKAEDDSHPLRAYSPYVYGFLAVTMLWALGLLALYLFGRRLSARTVSVIENSDPNDLTGGGHASLKATYRRLITFAGIYYYISQPIVMALVIAVTVGIVFAFLAAGRLPIAFLLGLVFVGGGSIFMMFKSWIKRTKVEDPGRALAVEEAPKLWELVTNVASEINTRPVDEIRVTPGTDLAVYERGGFRAKANDKGERILILGAGVLNGFSANAFRGRPCSRIWPSFEPRYRGR